MQRLRRNVQYEGLVVFDNQGRSYRAGSRSFGRIGAFGDTTAKPLLASHPSGLFTVAFTQVSGTPNNSTGAGAAIVGGNQGDPGRTYKDFTGGVGGLGTAPNFPGVPSAVLAAVQGYFDTAEGIYSAGTSGSPLVAAASNVEAQLSATAAQCVLYQQWDQPGGRSNQRGDIYSNWLQTLLSQLTAAQSTLAQASAQEAANATGQPSTKTAGGETFITAQVAPGSAGSGVSLVSSPTTVLGFPLTTVVIGGVVVLGLGYFLLRKKKPATAEVAT